MVVANIAMSATNSPGPSEISIREGAMPSVSAPIVPFEAHFFETSLETNVVRDGSWPSQSPVSLTNTRYSLWPGIIGAWKLPRSEQCLRAKKATTNSRGIMHGK